VSRAPNQPLQPWSWLGLPLLASLLATIVLATPLRVFGLRLPEPVFPLVLAFAWPIIRPSVLGAFALLFAGLVLDLIWGAPLGLWALCLLLVYGGVQLSRSLMTGRSAPALALWYLALTAFAFAAAYLFVTLRAHVTPNALGAIYQFLATLALFPFARLLIDRFEDADIRFR
jgi:rod shape-determining protein MreD